MKRLGHAPVCPGVDKHGKSFDVTHTWLVMAKYVFSTTLILLVVNLVFGIMNAFIPELKKVSDSIHALAGSLCFGNVIFIPCVIFAKYSRDCVGHSNPAISKNWIPDGPLGQEYKAFKTIFIVMLALSTSVFVIFLLFAMCIACCFLCCMRGR